MSYLNTTRTQPVTHEGGRGEKNSPELELALLAVTTFFGNKFYESADETLSRMQTLVRRTSPEFVDQLARFARQKFNMRASPAALMAFRVLEWGQPDDARVLSDVFARGDEIGDFLAVVTRYSKNGKATKSSLRLVGKVLNNLSERQVLRYPNHKREWSMAKALGVARPEPKNATQSSLFKFIRGWATGGGLKWGWNALNDEEQAMLPLIAKAVSGEDIDGAVSWERSRSAGVPFADLIDQMGYMALLRNLNNFNDADLTQSDWDKVINRLTDAEEIARSKQMPFRLFSAYNSGDRSLEVAAALESAMEHSVHNIPKLAGKTLIVVDSSASMTFSSVSALSNVRYLDIAYLFATSLLRQNNSATLVSFASSAAVEEIKPGMTILAQTKRLVDRVGRVGHGTELRSIESVVTPSEYDNVVIFSDLQVMDYNGDGVHFGDANVFSFDLAGYDTQAALEGNVMKLGGWSDTALALISTIADTSLVETIRNY